ncbi:hypothetical protein Dimus_021476 [Dionaea muscipula]
MEVTKDINSNPVEGGRVFSAVDDEGYTGKSQLAVGQSSLFSTVVYNILTERNARIFKGDASCPSDSSREFSQSPLRGFEPWKVEDGSVVIGNTHSRFVP